MIHIASPIIGEEEKQAVIEEKQNAVGEYERQLSALKDAIDAQQQSGLEELTTKYDALVAEKSTADQEHAAAMNFMKESIKDEHDSALADLQSKHDALLEKLSKTDQEH